MIFISKAALAPAVALPGLAANHKSLNSAMETIQKFNGWLGRFSISFKGK